MDLLDPLDQSSSTDNDVDNKVIINDNIDLQCKTSMESDDEQNVVDHLSPQTLLETPNEDGHYSLRSPEGMITYRVLQVDDGSVDTIPQIVTTTSNFSGTSSVPQVQIAGNQLFVISNPNEMFTTQGGARAIAPRSAIVDQTSNAFIKDIKKRDERRRATHNEVERRRRDKINNWIMKLSKIIPEGSPGEIKGNGHYDGQSKGGILAKACEYILELQEIEQKHESVVKENKNLAQTVELLKQKNFMLERENKEIKEILKQSGIEITHDDNS